MGKMKRKHASKAKTYRQSNASVSAAPIKLEGSRILKEREGQIWLKKVLLEMEPDKLRVALEPMRWKILKLLASSPTYPAELSKVLGEHEQKIYYHIRQLEKAGLIQVLNKQEFGGALAKIYAPTEHAFAIELPTGEEQLASFPMRLENAKLRSFLFPFINGGNFDAEIVVGSPDPHGPHQVRARDTHFAAELALFLGQFASIPKNLVTRLDVEVKAQNGGNKNMILIGGVLTNVITAELNKFLPVKFQTDKFPFRSIISGKTGKIYSDEEKIGIIAKLPNPFSREKSVLMLAGNTYDGTATAILALTRFTDEVLKHYKSEDNWVVVVQGFDMDGDGKIDSIKVIE